MCGLSCRLRTDPAFDGVDVGEAEGGERNLSWGVDELEVGQAGCAEVLLRRCVDRLQRLERYIGCL